MPSCSQSVRPTPPNVRPHGYPPKWLRAPPPILHPGNSQHQRVLAYLKQRPHPTPSPLKHTPHSVSRNPLHPSDGKHLQECWGLPQSSRVPTSASADTPHQGQQRQPQVLFAFNRETQPPFAPHENTSNKQANHGSSNAPPDLSAAIGPPPMMDKSSLTPSLSSSTASVPSPLLQPAAEVPGSGRVQGIQRVRLFVPIVDTVLVRIRILRIRS